MTPELSLQPGNGSQLTRCTDVVRRDGKPGVWYACACGRFLFVLRGRAVDGSQRPRACKRCMHRSQKRDLEQRYANTSERANPYRVWP